MLRFALGAIVVIFVVIFVVQNTQMVEVNFLAWSITLSRALMLLVILLVGIFLGWVTRGPGRRRR